jgi:glycerol-3-phosphate dehydrogenase
METDVADHLVHNYGDRAFAVAALASETGSRWPVMGRRLAYPYLFIEAEVRYACQREYACTAVDVLARRTRLAFLNAQAAADALPRIVEIMMDELKWSQERAQQEYADALSYLKTMGLDLQSSRAVFNREQIGQFKREFIKLDSDADGMVRIRQLVDSGLLPAVPKKYEPVSATAEVDFNEFLDVSRSMKNL